MTSLKSLKIPYTADINNKESRTKITQDSDITSTQIPPTPCAILKTQVIDLAIGHPIISGVCAGIGFLVGCYFPFFLTIFTLCTTIISITDEIQTRMQEISQAEDQNAIDIDDGESKVECAMIQLKESNSTH